MITSGTIAIGITATPIFTAIGATHISIRATTSALTTLGDNAVVVGNGYPLGLSASGIPEEIDLDLSDGVTIYGIGGGASGVNFLATN